MNETNTLADLVTHTLQLNSQLETDQSKIDVSELLTLCQAELGQLQSGDVVLVNGKNLENLDLLSLQTLLWFYQEVIALDARCLFELPEKIVTQTRMLGMHQFHKFEA